MNMKRNYLAAFNALKKIGCPVFIDPDDQRRFKISAEQNSHKEIWADYYDCMHLDFDGWRFGVNGKINRILDKHGLYAEWQNPGCLQVCES